MYKDMNLGAFMDALASGSATPGGGSAVAIAGTMACSLISMVCNLTIGRERFKENEGQVRAILSKSGALRAELIEDADRDSQAFGRVMEAMKMPGGSPEQKEVRDNAVQEAFKGAAAQPMAIGERCLKVLELAWELHDKGNPNASSDVAVAALLAGAALEGAIRNVNINLSFIKDKDFADGFRVRVEALRRSGDKLYRNTLANIV